MSNWWGWEKNSPSKSMSWIIFRCYEGSESFCVSSCSCHLISTFLTVSPMYESRQETTPWGFLRLSLNNCLIFLVIHLIWILHFLSVKTLNFFKKCFENSSFLIQYGISSNNDVVVKLFWLFLKAINDSIDISMWIDHRTFV